MKSKIWIVPVVLVLTSLACSLGGSPENTPEAEVGEEPVLPAAPAGDENRSGDVATGPLIYDVYVGASVTGNCGPMTNAGWFRQLSFSTAFHEVEVDPAAMDFFGGYEEESTIESFELCPMYNGEEHPCQVTDGPHPFLPMLGTGSFEDEMAVLTPVPPEGEEVPLVPLVPGTADPSTMQFLARFDSRCGARASRRSL